MAASDILFQDKNVCILEPTSSRGILIFTISTSWNICKEGLLSYNELRKRHPELGLKNRHHHDPDHDNLIFFRAPYSSDTSTFESSYDGKPPESMLSSYKNEALAIIRIDPENTFVFSSETRVKGKYEDLLYSRIPMIDYLTRIKGHKDKFAKYPEKICSNIKTYEKNIVPSYFRCHYPLEEYLPIERMAEVVVKLPHIPPEWFVSCITNEKKGGKSKNTTRKNRKRKYIKKKKTMKH